MDKIDHAPNPDSLDSCSKSIEETTTESFEAFTEQSENIENNPVIVEKPDVVENKSKTDMELAQNIEEHSEMVEEDLQESAKSPEETDETVEAGSGGGAGEIEEKQTDTANNGPGINKSDNIMDRLTDRNVRLPISRVKTIMKTDPDLTLVNQDAVFLIAKSTEYFIECLAKEAMKYTAKAKRRTVQRKDIDIAIEAVDALAFLEGALD